MIKMTLKTTPKTHQFLIVLPVLLFIFSCSKKVDRSSEIPLTKLTVINRRGYVLDNILVAYTKAANSTLIDNLGTLQWLDYSKTIEFRPTSDVHIFYDSSGVSFMLTQGIKLTNGFSNMITISQESDVLKLEKTDRIYPKR